MQILGLEKVRIMRFLGRKGELEGVLSGSDPDTRGKEKRRIKRIKQIIRFFYVMFAYVKKYL